MPPTTEPPRTSCRHCGGPAAWHLCSDGEWFEEDEDPAAVLAAFDRGRALEEHVFPPPPHRLPLPGEKDSEYWADRRAWPPNANTLHPVLLRKEGP